MGQRKDVCWDHVKNTSTSSKVSFECKYCLINFSGGASRIKAHLSKKENSGIRPCQKVPGDVVEMFIGRKRASLEMENGNMNSLPLRNTRPRVLEDKENKTRVDHKLARFLTVFNLSPKLVESSIFSNFVKSVVQYGSDYELPDPKTLDGLKRDYLHNDVGSYIMKVKESIWDAGCTLIVDVNGGLYAYSLGGALHQQDLTDKGTCNVIRCIDSIGSTKVLQIFFDGYDSICGSDLKQHLIDRYQWLKVGFSPAFEVRCLLRCLLELKNLQVVLKAAGQMITESSIPWIHVQLDEDHMIPCPSADYYGIGEIIDTIDELWRLKQLLKLRGDGQKLIVGDSVTAKDDWCWVNHMIHCERFWVQVEGWASVLQPFFEALFLMIDECCPPSGYLYQIMERLKVAIIKCRRIFAADIIKINLEFARIQERFMHPMYTAATLLNPVYMYNESFREDGHPRNGINFIQNSLVETNEKETFENDLHRYCSKDRNIFTTDAISALISHHPARWWKCYGDSVPTLQKYAIRILSQPCHSPFYGNFKPKWDLKGYPCDTKDAVMMETFGQIGAERLKGIDVSNVGLPEWLREHSTEVFSVEEIRMKSKSRFLSFKCLLEQGNSKTCPFCGLSWEDRLNPLVLGLAPLDLFWNY